MSFNTEKYREHEAAAEKALADKDYRKALFHTAKAAQFGLKLAEQSEGKLKRKYAEDAFQLIDLAEEIERKTSSRTSAKEPEELDGSEDSSPPSEFELGERPDVRLSDVAGLDEVKRVLMEDVILPFKHPDVYERFDLEAGAGVLMYGPPGNGKTYIAKAIAGELDAAFFPVDCAQIKDKYVGETEKNMKRLFDEARSKPRAVLFFDEVESLLHRRGNQKINTVTQFLSLTDGIRKIENCLLLLAATNKPWTLDPAVLRPGRLGTHVYVGLPDDTARKAMFVFHLRKLPLSPSFTPDLLDVLVERSVGYSGADIDEVCRRAKKLAALREISSATESALDFDDFQKSLAAVTPSVSKEILDQFEDWRRSFSLGSSDEHSDEADD